MPHPPSPSLFTQGGVYEEVLDKAPPNHEVSIVGWGTANNTEYWIVRNSWGTYFGEMGYFRIRMHKNNLDIEKYCSWGVPIIPAVTVEGKAGPSVLSLYAAAAEITGAKITLLQPAVVPSPVPRWAWDKVIPALAQAARAAHRAATAGVSPLVPFLGDRLTQLRDALAPLVSRAPADDGSFTFFDFERPCHVQGAHPPEEFILSPLPSKVGSLGSAGRDSGPLPLTYGNARGRFPSQRSYRVRSSSSRPSRPRWAVWAVRAGIYFRDPPSHQGFPSPSQRSHSFWVRSSSSRV